MHRISGLVLILAAVLPVLVAAQPAGTVVALNSPAWVIDGGRVQALTPARPLVSGDRVKTGPGGRVLLALADGSEVRLGEGAEFVLSAAPDREDPGLFRGVLDVLQGAFRYTTTLLGAKRRRDLRVRIAGVTAGIRGTDVWGRAAPDRDILCLIEGEVAVLRDDAPPLRMSEPLTFYVAPRGAPPLPVAPVAPEQLARWAESVALASDRGVLRGEGGIGVVLESDLERANALATRERLQGQGYPAELESADVGGQQFHRVVVRGFADVPAAQAFIGAVRERTGVAGAFVVPAR